MSAQSTPLGLLTVQIPCHVSWDAMKGDGQIRFCSQCRLNVYNLSEMSRESAAALVQQHEGRLCVRFYQRPDGSVLTEECSGWKRILRRRLAFCVAAAAALFLACGGPLLFRADASGGKGRRGIRNIKPFRTILDWLNPPVVQGRLCPPVKSQPPPQQENVKDKAKPIEQGKQ